MDKNFIRQMKDRLLGELEETEDMLRGLNIILRAPQSKNLEEKSDQVIANGPISEQEGKLLIKETQIGRALARIENETYGVCLRCDCDIPEKRLNALPFVPECIDCKSDAEAARKTGR